METNILKTPEYVNKTENLRETQPKVSYLTRNKEYIGGRVDVSMFGKVYMMHYLAKNTGEYGIYSINELRDIEKEDGDARESFVFSRGLGAIDRIYDRLAVKESNEIIGTDPTNNAFLKGWTFGQKWDI